MYNLALGERIRLLREAVDVGQAEMARILRMHKTTLGKIELGRRSLSPYQAAEISAKFGVSTDYLLRGRLDGVTERSVALALVRLCPALDIGRENNGPDIPRTSSRGGRFRATAQ